MNFLRRMIPMLKLATPIVAAELGWYAMAMVDTMMVGRVSAAALAGTSLGGVLFSTVAIFGTGVFLGLDTLVSHSFGRGDVEDCHHTLAAAFWLILPLGPLLAAISWLWVPLVALAGIDPLVLEQTGPYLKALSWGAIPLMMYFALRRYLQGMNIVRPVVYALASANLVNAGANYVLIYGKLGFPAMGAEGAGWATTVARVYMAGFLLVYVAMRPNGLWQRHIWRPDLLRMKRIIGLGLPAAGQIVFEIGVFGLVTALIARIGATATAAHQIALTAVSATYMVPLGIGSAGAVRVGQALGRRDFAAARTEGWAAVALGTAFMSLAGVVFLLFPNAVARLFTDQQNVIDTSVKLIYIGAFFQLFDGAQACATGALRGAGDTRTPMLAHLILYWAVGLPIGYYLTFHQGAGAAGLWTGLCVALIAIGVVLFTAWIRRTGHYPTERASFDSSMR